MVTHFYSLHRLLLPLLDKVITPLVAGVMGLLLLLLPADAYQFWHEPSAYIVGQHLDVNAPEWQWQYLRRSALFFLVAAGVLGIIGAAWLRPQKQLLCNASRVCVLLVIAAWLKGYLDWAATGFDH